MSNWNGLILTERGRNLQLKAEAGETLVLTKIKLGSGVLDDGETLDELTDLKNVMQEVGISSREVTDDGYCKITGVITNSDLETGYYVREMGVYADDPDEGEILYAVTTDDSPDYLPAYGGAIVISQEFAIYVAVGNATDITVNIDQQGMATVSNLQQLASAMLRAAYSEEDETLTLTQGDYYIVTSADTVSEEDAIAIVEKGTVTMTTEEVEEAYELVEE